jgi:exosortase A-associated hydrolase 2
VQSFFATGARGRRFVLHHRPAAARAARGGIVYVHPFAEEMNKSRHVVARMARRFAAAGWHVLQIDLFGCGDSDGDFRDASWEAWLEDVDTGVRSLQSQCEGSILLWGLRAGALVCASWAAESHRPARCLFWHPVVNGSAHLQQFLRIRAMSGLAGGDRTEGAGALRERLRQEGALEVAGYELPAPLADALDRASLDALPAGSRIHWLDLVNRPDPTLGGPSVAQVERLRQRGVEVDAIAVTGPSFWQSVELEDAPALRDATARMLELSDA